MFSTRPEVTNYLPIDQPTNLIKLEMFSNDTQKYSTTITFIRSPCVGDIMLKLT